MLVWCSNSEVESPQKLGMAQAADILSATEGNGKLTAADRARLRLICFVGPDHQDMGKPHLLGSLDHRIPERNTACSSICAR